MFVLCQSLGAPDITYSLQLMLSFFVIVFGFLNGSEISLPEQGEPTILEIGFIKGGNVQSLTGIDRRNTARFCITVAGSASKWELLELFYHRLVIRNESHMKQ